MFPRKAKPADYLDIFDESERKVFLSPVKIGPACEPVPEDPAIDPPASYPLESGIATDPVIKDIDVEIKDDAELQKGIYRIWTYLIH
jgi:hypothetical protein